MARWYLYVLLIFAACGSIGLSMGDAAEPIATVGPVAATLPAATRRWRELASTSHPPLVGQNLGHAIGGIRDGFSHFVLELGEKSGCVPGLLGVDYGMDRLPSPLAISEANRYLIAFARRGGMVTVSMHPPNPWRGTGSHDTDKGAWEDLFEENSIVRRQWLQTLDRMADGLSELQQAGVPVLWRPFHEMNGDWFWWAPREKGRWLPPEAFHRLWRDTFRYVTEERGLRNLLWVYAAAMRQSPNQPPIDRYYPGAQYVDVVAVDWYTDHPQWADRYENFAKLSALGKPMALAEFGPLQKRNGQFDPHQLDAVLGQFEFAYILYWHSWPQAKVALADLEQGPKWLKSRSVRTLPYRATEPQPVRSRK